MQVYNGNDLAKCLTDFGCGCVYNDYNITPTATVYRFFVLPTSRITLASIKNAIFRLGFLLKTEINYSITAGGFNLKLYHADNQRQFPTFNELYTVLHNEKAEFLLGIDDNGDIQTLSIDDCPHLLVAGQTGSGKSVFINSLIASLICKNKNVNLVLIDVKKVEFAKWRDSLHLCCPPITETDKAISYLNVLVGEMERRYNILADNGLDKDINGFFPKIIVIIDELADLMLASRNEVETPIVRLAQKSRACGIHLVLSTQRPTVNVVTGLIKANMPTRIAFSMASVRDSMTILDHKGAESLRGQGDCIVALPNGKEIHCQAPLITSTDIYSILEPCRAYKKAQEEKNQQLKQPNGKIIYPNATNKPQNKPKNRFMQFLDNLFAHRDKKSLRADFLTPITTDEIIEYECFGGDK